MERELHWADVAATRAFGRRLGPLLRGGDVLVLTGDLGAGKTTLTQAIGEGLGVRGPVTSPTFVIARLHPSLVGGPDLVHVDAYRLGSAVELDDLDLDADLDHSVTVVEWGAGLAEQLSDARLEITLRGDGERTARVVGVGDRWDGVLLLLSEPGFADGPALASG
ncbi:tRNA (N6-adenosine(37)-N6)-threonylcarbamoyltransferase complex ATPase TsaE [Humibacillus sp. DSM 29435]|uniref:tRNA (adenosine(37)-N6)-threonylcarbamoyltransferase complex ATPase subunit type 1 TsaE n=1 Tax=Humibacillus sp. DSM 29435 TaxID=1869167 RepID=UPI000872C2E3|nr:tRNA (adenosine(37)-N6)-threonylcarbamoyltransferase complex ATPase subunit type 1 TsaE [Humibacillus sp. DSM 29435]OFE14745.1 tRNA (N6-adenosine(37)-N6)-threonylcarbamoyltransferase complex ATPase TsaE [Humibacillus sp. DSM 29435]